MTFFHMFIQSIKFYTLYYHILRVLIFENCDSSNRQENEWLLLSPSFTAKFGLAFVLTLENAFSYGFCLKAHRKSIYSSKKQSKGFSK